jgi:hypothetical protein
MFRYAWHWMQFLAVTAASALATVVLLTTVSAFAADISADSLKLAPGVIKASEGYESAPVQTYIVANPTSIFGNHFYYDSKVTGELKLGEKVQPMAKVKGYDWVLVGKNGQGIGYVPISMLAPEGQYRPS